MSILVVNVGSEAETNLSLLAPPECHVGRRNLQIVHFDKHVAKNGSVDSIALAKELLQNTPRELVEFMLDEKIVPNQRRLPSFRTPVVASVAVEAKDVDLSVETSEKSPSVSESEHKEMKEL